MNAAFPRSTAIQPNVTSAASACRPCQRDPRRGPGSGSALAVGRAPRRSTPAGADVRVRTDDWLLRREIHRSARPSARGRPDRCRVSRRSAPHACRLARARAPSRLRHDPRPQAYARASVHSIARSAARAPPAGLEGGRGRCVVATTARSRQRDHVQPPATANMNRSPVPFPSAPSSRRTATQKRPSMRKRCSHPVVALSTSQQYSAHTASSAHSAISTQTSS